MGACWRIELFGGLSAVSPAGAGGDGREVTRFRTQKAGALLAYLAYYRDRWHPREILIELLWPGCDPSFGRNRLSLALSALRRQLELPGIPGVVIAADRFSVRLEPEAVTSDVGEFEAALQSAAGSDAAAERVRYLARAVDLYRGDLLTGDHEEWVLREREFLAEAYFLSIRELLALLETEGELRQAIQYARRAVRVDPLREEPHRELMRLLAAAGRPAAALRQYRELERLLQKELGTAPEEATRVLLASLGETGERGSEGARERGNEGAFTPSLLLSSPRFLAPSPVGGAVPLDAATYVARGTDDEFRAAIARQDSIVLVKGAREIGKTSLLARGLHLAREAGARIVFTDFQRLGADHLASAETLLRTLAEWMAAQVDLQVLPHETWNPHRGPTINFELYLQSEVLGKSAAPLVWGLDDLDRLFTCDFGSEIFALLRSWHNARSFDPTGPWSRLTLAITYATEAHLFLTDLSESPFNVGTRLTLDDFNLEEVAELNRRYGSPLPDNEAVERLYRLVRGHPYLVCRGLSELAAGRITLPVLEAQGERDGGIFDGHLRRLLASLTRNPPLCDVMRGVLQGRRCPSAESFYRLRTAGLIVGESTREAHPRCQLYATYLERHLL